MCKACCLRAYVYHARPWLRKLMCLRAAGHATQTGKKIGGSIVVEDASERAALEAELPVSALAHFSTLITFPAKGGMPLFCCTSDHAHPSVHSPSPQLHAPPHLVLCSPSLDYAPPGAIKCCAQHLRAFSQRPFEPPT